MPAPSSLVLALGTASVPKTFTSLQNVGLLWSKVKMITRLTLVTWCETHRVMPSRLNSKAYESVIDCWSYSLVPLLTAHLGILLLLFPFFCGNPSVSHGTSLPWRTPSSTPLSVLCLGKRVAWDLFPVDVIGTQPFCPCSDETRAGFLCLPILS